MSDTTTQPAKSTATRQNGKEPRRFSREKQNPSRSPRPNTAEDELASERAALEAVAFRLIARRREVRMELGRTFIRIKAILKHGRWKSYFAETFGESGITLRTAQRYMDLVQASEAQDSQNDKMSLFKSACDPQAIEIRDVTERAKAEVGDAVRHTQKGERVYKLALHLSMAERVAADQLWKSPYRPRAEKKIIDLLRQLCIEFHSLDAENPA